MRHHLMSGLILATFVSAPLLGADRATTAPATQPSQRIDVIKNLLAQLSADSSPQRELARVALMGLKRGELPILREAVKASLPLDPNQVSVLREIVTQIYLAGDLYAAEEDGHGFLGIHLPYWGKPEERSLLSLERGVAVVSRVPGFCSYRMLQDGDVLLAMVVPGGTIEVNTNEQLIDAVTGAKAGDTVTFEVLRQGRILKIAITLDRKPLNLTTQLEEFSARRADQANEFWERDFAPLLAAQMG
jgi:hypothetical protein